MNLFERVSQAGASKEMCAGSSDVAQVRAKYETELFRGLKEVTAKAPFRQWSLWKDFVYVGGDDELRRVRMDYRRDGLSIRPRRSRD